MDPIIPVNLLQPFVDTCGVKLMMARQDSHAISFLVLDQAYVASVDLHETVTKEHIRQT